MENLARWGHEANIAVGFAAHLDARHFEREDLCFREENIGGYLEEFDNARSQYPNVTLGVELEFYPDRPDLMEFTQEWLDRHRGDLDRVLGSAHYVFGDYAVTWHVHLRELVGKKTFAQIMDEYIRGERALVASGIADCLPHADVVFRGHRGIFDVDPAIEIRGREAIIGICRNAASHGMAIEVNLLGVVDGTYEEPSPSWDMIKALARDDVIFYVGSDAHDSAGFKAAIPIVIDTYQRLRVIGARTPSL
jgi:HisJ family histidinol phosphate phosphatase